MSAKWENDPASPKQLAAIAKELTRRVYPALGDTPEAALAAFVVIRQQAQAAGKDIRKGWASHTLDALFAAPFVQTAGSAHPVTEPGFYIKDGTVYRVVSNKAGTHLYAKVLVITSETFSWEYAPGAFRLIDAGSVMTPAAAAEFGRLNDRCAYCGRSLSDPISQAFYMGPVCSTKYAGIKRSQSKAAYAEAEAILATRADARHAEVALAAV